MTNSVLNPMPREYISADPPTVPSYYPWFDWLRAICACTVMLFHDGALPWSHSGNFAVQVFFALSGWLIGGVLIKLEPKDLTRFYFNRAIRIWIPYYIAAALLLTLSVFREPITAKWIEIVIYKLTFVYNLFGTPQLATFHDAMPQKGTLSHFWSVNAEEQFYLLAPLLLVAGARHLGKSILLWIIIAIPAHLFGIYPSIILGVIASLIAEKHGPIHLSNVGRFCIGIVLISGVVILRWGPDLYYEYITPITSVAIVLLLAKSGIQHRFGQIFGGMSYPLYLNHWIAMFGFNFLMPGMRDSPARIILSAVFNVLIAIFMYWWIDRRLIAHRGEWFTDSRGRIITLTAYTLLAIGLAYGIWMCGFVGFLP